MVALHASATQGSTIGMVFSSRISLQELVGLCRRLAWALGAGVDVRRVFQREAERARGHLRRGLTEVRRAVDRGETVSHGLAAAGNVFPPLVRELTEVGEQTGGLSEVFLQLADHYQGRLELRRNFLAAIAWPVIQLVLALGIVGFLIWIMGFICDATGQPIDPLGVGLVGTGGLVIYLLLLAAVAGAVLLAVQGMRRGVAGLRILQRLLMRVPVLGRPLQTLALARLAWALHLTLGAGMEVRRALALSLRTTNNARYTDRIPRMDAMIARGNSMHDAFLAAGVFPVDFLDSLAVAEESGKLVESMATLSRQYRDRARAALGTLTMLAAWAVWGVVALIIIGLIFRLAMTMWFGVYQDLLP